MEVPKREESIGHLSGCPWPIELLAVERGGAAEETALHARFAADRIRGGGEWFAPSPAILAYVDDVLATCGAPHEALAAKEGESC